MRIFNMSNIPLKYIGCNQAKVHFLLAKNLSTGTVEAGKGAGEVFTDEANRQGKIIRGTKTESLSL